MDEIWQRHKAFILQCVIGGIVFLIAWGVKANMYDGIEHTADTNGLDKRKLEEQLRDGKAPSRKSIREQEELARLGEANFRALAASVASVASPADGKREYVRENIRWALVNVGNEGDTDRLINLYTQLPQQCLFDLSEQARGVLVGRAAQAGKTVDESLGISQAYQAEELPVAIHGLALVTEIVTRALDSTVADGIDAITDIRIAPRQRRSARGEGDEASKVVTFPVSFRVVGHPDAVSALIRSFNQPIGHAKRFIVLDGIESISRPRDEEVTISAGLRILGMHHLGVGGE